MPIGQLGMMLAGAGLGQLLAPINDRRQLRQQEKLQNLQIAGQQQMTDYNLRKQMQLWEQTNYKAQVDQLKKAGLNPALLYGHGGPGGQTNIDTANVGIGQAPQGGGEIMGIMGMGQQAAMTAAQIELTKAQTQKTKAETGNVPLTAENIKASTAGLLQGIEESKTKQAMIDVETAISNIKHAIAGATQNAEIAKIMYGLEILNNDRTISTETRSDKIKHIKAEATGAVLENYLTTAQTQLTEQQKAQSIQSVKTMIQQGEQNWRRILNESFKIHLDENQLRGLYKDAGEELREIIDNILIIPTIGKPGHKPVTGFQTGKNR